MNLAVEAATTRSQASAMLAPAPAATPLTLAITGCGSAAIWRTSGFHAASTVAPRSVGPWSALTARSLRSCPAQNPRPAPVRTTTRASPRLDSAARSSSCIARVKLFSRQGLDWTERFPVVAHALADVAVKRAIIDGEVVVQTATGVTSFPMLVDALKNGSGDMLFYSFDLLYLDATTCATRR